MKRRILMVSAMILLLGSQVDMFAQKKGEPDFKRPGMEMRDCRKQCKHQDKRFISQEDVKRLQNFYWDKYKVRLSYKEAEQILLVEMKDKKPAPPAPRGPQKPFKK